MRVRRAAPPDATAAQARATGRPVGGGSGERWASRSESENTSATMASGLRGNLRFVAAAALLLALVPVGYYAFLARPPAATGAGEAAGRAPNDAGEATGFAAGPGAADAAAEPASPAPELRIAEVDGTVEVRRAQGQFLPAAAGLVLGQDDTLRTSDGRARLVASGDVYEVQVEPGTFFEVGALQPKLANLRLGLGMLLAKVQPGAGARLEVAATSSDARASTSGGSFAMSNNGSGTVAVGAKTGEVEFQAAGKAVLLRAGEQSIARPNRAPEAPTPIPSSVFLKVDWPSDARLKSRRVTVSGRTTPGAILILGGQAVRVEADGRFSAAVRLREGRNTLEAKTLDLGENHAHSQVELEVDTVPPDSKISTDKLWNDR